MCVCVCVCVCVHAHGWFLLHFKVVFFFIWIVKRIFNFFIMD